MNKFDKIILVSVSVLFFVVIILVITIFRLQKKIDASSSGLFTGFANQSVNEEKVASSASDLKNVIKQFNAKIVDISGNQLIVDAELTDFSKPKNSDKLKNASGPVSLAQNDYETMMKKITVIINENANLGAKKLSDLKTGNTVSVVADKSPYNSDTVTAQSVAVAGK